MVKADFRYLLPIAVLLVLAGCSPLRKVDKDDYLLVKNKVIQEGAYKNDDEIKDYILTKPNKKMLGMVRFRLQVYNMVNQEKMHQRRAYLDSAHEAKNAVRVAKGKKPKLNQRSTLRERLLKFGEPPALYEENESKQSVKNIERFLFNKGYFNGAVRDSVVLKKNRRAKAYYIVNRNRPYTLIEDARIDVVDNKKLEEYTKNYAKYTILKKGDRFDLDKMDDDRTRLTKHLRRKGYYFFNKEYIEFKADTGIGDHQILVTMVINEPDFNIKVGDSLVNVKKHRPARIRNIYIDADYNPSDLRPMVDTIPYGGFFFTHRGNMSMTPEVVARQIILETGNYFNTDDNDLSYRNLSNLRSFRNIAMEFIYQGHKDNVDILDCRIILSPALKQSFSIDFQGTTTGTYPGIESNFGYRNRNAFMGSETFEFKVFGRAESQLVSSESQFSLQNLFNTLEIGNEISIRIPKFLLPFRSLRYSKRNSPFTNIRVNNAYQTRPDYNRFISTFSFGYEWQENKQRYHRYAPLEFSIIRVQKSSAFEQELAKSNNQFLQNSFRDHILLHNVYSYTYSNFVDNRPGKYFSFRGNAQIGGNLLYLMAVITKFPQENNDNKRYTILNTPFAQFIRLEPDFRSYLVFNKTNTVALRGLLGIGIPYLNSMSMPFEKSFSAGGATDMRGWRARRLGPGSYNQGSSLIFDQFSDLKLLLQAEYRVTVIKQIELGIFVDAGNIWALRKDPNRPGANFDIKRFHQEIALGAGIGVRLNLGFFIFRVDPGIPLYDPTVVPVANRWVVPHLKFRSIVWNFAINYPF